jgi:hypothetical protein
MKIKMILSVLDNLRFRGNGARAPRASGRTRIVFRYGVSTTKVAKTAELRILVNSLYIFLLFRNSGISGFACPQRASQRKDAKRSAGIVHFPIDTIVPICDLVECMAPKHTEPSRDSYPPLSLCLSFPFA